MLPRTATKILRAAEAVTRFFGGMPWKIERFNSLIAPDVRRVVADIGRAEVIVGIPFNHESDNICALTRKILNDLDERGQPAAIVIVAERKTRRLLNDHSLPYSTNLIHVVTLAKPFGFGQRPGLTRRSFSHWAILHIANRVRADVIFIDADVRNPEGWIPRYLDAIQNRRAAIAVANYVRNFSGDDAIVHVWDSLLFGAVFQEWIAFRHGGDYAVSRSLIPAILQSPTVMRERAYTMDSAIMRLASEKGASIEAVWLGEKIHSPITSQALFNRLPSLVESVFVDVATHLGVLAKLRRMHSITGAGARSPVTRPMSELVGRSFREELHQDQSIRFRRVQGEMRRILGRKSFEAYAAASAANYDHVAIAPQLWARATMRFLKAFVRNREQPGRTRIVNAYIPVLQLGILGFLNRSYAMSYQEAQAVLEHDYLPEFREAWNALARQISVPQFPILRRWPVRVRTTITGVLRRL